MSSYSSSTRAIIRGRQRPSAPASTNAALLVAMENTPGHSRLPFAAKEVQILDDLCKSMALTPIEPKRNKKDVVSVLQECKLFHFAGHGNTHEDNPLKSHLLLEDWQSDPLTVADFLAINLHMHSPFLAYLSACGTGRINHEVFIDESVHLISASQLVGFRHVIGTLWEVNDELCVGVAKTVYEVVRDEGMSNMSVCRGLHQAILEFRNHWLDVQGGSRGTSRRTSTGGRAGGGVDSHARDVSVYEEDDDAETSSLLGWVPYVHYGV